MPIPDVVNLVSSLRLDSESINTWKAGVERRRIRSFRARRRNDRVRDAAGKNQLRGQSFGRNTRRAQGEFEATAARFGGAVTCPRTTT